MKLGEFEPIKKLKLAYSSLTLREYEQRRLFLKQIEHSAPQVLKSLYEEIFTPCSKYLPLDYDKVDALCALNMLRNWEKEKLGPNGSNIGREVWALKGAPLPPDLAFSREMEAERVWCWDHEDLSWYGLELADKENYPEMVIIRDSLVQWSKPWNLNVAWCLERALSTLSEWLWQQQDEIPILFQWSHANWHRKIEANRNEEVKLLPSEKFPRWLPFEMRQREYLSSLERDLIEHISQHPIWSLCLSGNLKSHADSLIRLLIKEIREGYCKKVTDLYEGAGYERLTERPQSTKYIEWSVRVQINGASCTEVALEFGTDPAHVSRRVHALLSLIGLPPRSDLLPGRPKGKRDSKPRRIAQD